MRLTEKYKLLKIITPDGRVINRPMRGYYHPSGDISQNYDKIGEALLATGIVETGLVGEAKSYICDARKMVDLVSSFLQRDH